MQKSRSAPAGRALPVSLALAVAAVGWVAGCGASHPGVTDGGAGGTAPDGDGNDGDSGDDGAAATDAGADDGAAPSDDQQRAAAVRATVASNAACASLSAFYWEIGDRDGVRASGPGGDSSAGAVDPAASMPIASASKLIFGAYALETHALDEIVANGWDAYLNFTSGYDNMSDVACDLTATVGACFGAGSNGQRTDGDVGKFYYNGGHLQAYAVNVAMLGDDHRVGLGRPLLSDDVEAVLGGFGLSYVVPQLAGGAAVPPQGYGLFLRRVLGGLRIRDALGARAVCAWTNHPGECDAVYSPVNQTRPGGPNDVSDYKWHYALAHWVEDDGTFSSPGAFGFYPWIDASKTYYGLLARHDTTGTRASPPYFSSVVCGRLIRAAWFSGRAQL